MYSDGAIMSLIDLFKDNKINKIINNHGVIVLIKVMII